MIKPVYAKPSHKKTPYILNAKGFKKMIKLVLL
jgi:hypothetical protein